MALTEAVLQIIGLEAVINPNIIQIGVLTYSYIGI